MVQKIYVIANGNNKGIYHSSWDNVRKYIDDISNIKHKSFKDKDEARKYYRENQNK